MSDEDAPKAFDPSAVDWIRAPEFRVVHTNFFRYRVAQGEAYLTFSTLVDGPPNQRSAVADQVSLAMAWPQLKLVTRSLNEIINAIEQEIGEIVQPTVTDSAIAYEREQIQKQLRAVYLRPPAPKSD